MTTPSYVLNLSPVTIVTKGKPTKRIDLRIFDTAALGLPPDFLSRAAEIERPEEIPEGRFTTDDPIILYIVAHGVPNGIMNRRRLVDEKALAKKIIRQRKEAPTLIVWDVCFAKSFLQIEGLRDSWTPNYVHIFCCEEYERTWQTGNATKPPRQTLFSKELREALGALNGQRLQSWTTLEEKLQDQFGLLQTPSIHPKDGLQPDRFVLA
jgi:hypothetical protein